VKERTFYKGWTKMSQYINMPNQEQAVRTIPHGYLSAVTITPSDSTVFAQTKALYLGASGNVAVTMADGTTATFTALAAGVFHLLSVKQIKATGTTATGIIALY
jgi:hypothetical protein